MGDIDTFAKWIDAGFGGVSEDRERRFDSPPESQGRRRRSARSGTDSTKRTKSARRETPSLPWMRLGTDGDDALARYDSNGRITCQEARRHGIAPVQWGHPAYRYMRDGDGDGVVCE